MKIKKKEKTREREKEIKEEKILLTSLEPLDPSMPKTLESSFK